MAKDNNILYWVIGIILFLIVASNLNIIPQFAIVTKTACIDNNILYKDFNSGSVQGVIGNALELDTNDSINIQGDDTFIVMWIKDYSLGDTRYYFVANLNGTNYVDGVQSNSKTPLEFGPDFGLGFNGSIDELGAFSFLDESTMLDIYNNGTGREICYTTSYEENITCRDYAKEQTGELTEGCVFYSGDFFPKCLYSVQQQSVYTLENNQCVKQYYCDDGDYSYSACQDAITDIPTTTQTTPTTTTGTITENNGGFTKTLGDEVLNLKGYSIKLWMLIASLLVIIAIIYSRNGK